MTVCRVPEAKLRREARRKGEQAST